MVNGRQGTAGWLERQQMRAVWGLLVPLFAVVAAWALMLPVPSTSASPARVPVMQAGSPPAAAAQRPAAPAAPATALSTLRLEGVLHHAARPAQSRALVAAGASARWFAIGEAVLPGATLHAIAPEAVQIAAAQGVLTLPLARAAPGTQPSAVAVPAVAAARVLLAQDKAPRLPEPDADGRVPEPPAAD